MWWPNIALDTFIAAIAVATILWCFCTHHFRKTALTRLIKIKTKYNHSLISQFQPAHLPFPKRTSLKRILDKTRNPWKLVRWTKATTKTATKYWEKSQTSNNNANRQRSRKNKKKHGIEYFKNKIPPFLLPFFSNGSVFLRVFVAAKTNLDYTSYFFLLIGFGYLIANIPRKNKHQDEKDVLNVICGCLFIAIYSIELNEHVCALDSFVCRMFSTWLFLFLEFMYGMVQRRVPDPCHRF